MSATIRRATTHAGDPAWQVTGYRTVRGLLADPRLGRSHPDPEHAPRYANSAIFGAAQQATPTEREDHVQMRRLLTPAFSARRMAALRPRVRELVDGLLEDLAARDQPADFHEAVSFPLPVLVICELLGVPYGDRESFRRWSDDAADTTDRERSAAGLGALWKYMGELVERKRREPAADVVSDLAAAADAGRMDSAHAAMLAAGLLFAGHETTVAAIDAGVLLLTDPAFREALRDPERVPGAVEEVLRLDWRARAAADTAAGLPRWANAEIELDGVTIAAGDLVVLDLKGANLDPEAFPEPRRCDPERTGNTHLTFGHGAYFCIGAPLARVELTTLFGALSERFPQLRPAVPRADLAARAHLITGGLAHLPVTW